MRWQGEAGSEGHTMDAENQASDQPHHSKSRHEIVEEVEFELVEALPVLGLIASALFMAIFIYSVHARLL